MEHDDGREFEIRQKALAYESERRVGEARTIDRLLAILISTAMQFQGEDLRLRFQGAFGSRKSCYTPPPPEKELFRQELADEFHLDIRVLSRAYECWLRKSQLNADDGGAATYTLSGSADWISVPKEIREKKRELTEEAIRYVADVNFILTGLSTASPPTAVRMLAERHESYSALVEYLRKAVLKEFAESGAGRPRQRFKGVSVKDVELYYFRVVQKLKPDNPQCWRPFLQEEDKQTSDIEVIRRAKMESARALTRAKNLLDNLPKTWPKRAGPQRPRSR